jgi:P-type E1-E2 ATPase
VPRPAAVRRFEEAIGDGIRAWVVDQPDTEAAAEEEWEVCVGRPDWLQHTCAVALPVNLRERAQELLRRGASVSLIALCRLGSPRHASGVLSFEGTVRPEAGAAVRALARAGVRMGVVSGDAEAAVRRAAAQLAPFAAPQEIAVYAQHDPAAKLALLRQLQKEGRVVAMVGDGLNGTPLPFRRTDE